MYTSYARANQLMIVSNKIFFFFTGVFGNLCLIFLVIRKKQLQTKSSILQATQCFSHIMCLIGTQVDAVLTILEIQLPRKQCYPLVSGYVFFETAQAMIMLALVIDILVVVKLPRFYHNFSTFKYVMLMILPAIIYGSVFFFWGFTGLNDDIILFCNPPLAQHKTATTWFANTIMILCFLVLAVFLILIRIFYVKGQNHHKQSYSMKVMRRLQLSVVIFVLSWLLSQCVIPIFMTIGIDEEISNFLVANMSFFVLLSFSQTFYVIMWSSKEYRQHFLGLWCCSKGSGSQSGTGNGTVIGSTNKAASSKALF